MVNVAILGFGTVGSGVAEVLTTNGGLIDQRVENLVRLKYILDVRDFPDSPYRDCFVKDFGVIESDPEVDIVVETIGGATVALDFTTRALKAGKSVVSSNKELVARVKTQLRRSTRYNQPASAPAEVQEYDFRGLQISKTNHKCILFGDELSLTPLEFSILWYLCQHRGQVVSSEELFEKAWGEKYFNSNNTVMVHIRRLREKMHEPPKNPRFIKTVWGVGYKIEK